jgi:hypothetical protein
MNLHRQVAVTIEKRQYDHGSAADLAVFDVIDTGIAFVDQ